MKNLNTLSESDLISHIKQELYKTIDAYRDANQNVKLYRDSLAESAICEYLNTNRTMKDELADILYSVLSN